MPWSVAVGSLVEDFSQSQPCKWHLGAPSRIHPHNWHMPTPTILCPTCTFCNYLLIAVMTFRNIMTPRALILESKIFLNRILLTLASSSQALTSHRLEPKSHPHSYASPLLSHPYNVPYGKMGLQKILESGTYTTHTSFQNTRPPSTQHTLHKNPPFFSACT